MKRRRHALQVSTFPFLAVLLCAMGSLILLLLVIDRRAKEVARAKALQLVARFDADAEETASRRRHALEQHRQAMYAELKNQTESVLNQIQTVRGQSSTAERETEADEKRRTDAQRQVETLVEDIAKRRTQIENHESDIEMAAKHTQEHARERARMTDELVRLEKALADIKANRQQEKPTYSLIPYRGKQGDNRRPLYIECNATNLVCHPDKTEIAVTRLRAEIESRMAARRAVETSTLDETPYLLFLVRPAGIATYYGAMKALSGMKWEYGYEFVDDDWVFDFSDTDTNVAQRPTDDHPTAAAEREKKSNASPGRSADTSVIGGAQVSVNNGWTARGPRLGPPANGRSDSAAYLNSGYAPSEERKLGPRSIRTNPEILATTPGAGTTLGGLGQRTDSVSESGKVASTHTGRAPPSGGTAVNQAGAQPTGEVGDPSLALRAGENVESADASKKLTLPPGVRPSGEPSDPSLALRADTGVNTADVSRKHTLSPGVQPAGEQTNAVPEADRQPGRPLSPIADSSPSAGGRLVRVTPSRDWIISVECTSNGILVSPGAIPFSFAALTLTHADNPLQQTVQQMLVRRQAMARPGEAGERPVIHFRIRPDGLRAYHLAYQILERMRAPMTRENLRAEPVRPEEPAEVP